MSWKGAAKVAVKKNFGAVKVSEGAVILAKSSREGLSRPGNPVTHRDKSAVQRGT
jgi:hypothetical protein